MNNYNWLKILTASSLTIIPLISEAQSTTTTTTSQVTVAKPAIITPVPKAECTQIAAHWEGSTWVEAHDICKYTNRTEGVAWVSSYWTCTEATADGSCTSWSLVPGRWITTLPN